MKEIKLANIISEIDDDILSETLVQREKYLKHSKRKKLINFKYWIAVAACLTLCLSIIPILRYQLNDITEKQIGIWKVQSGENDKPVLSRKTTNGTLLELIVEMPFNNSKEGSNGNGSQNSIKETLDPCLVLFGQWYTSILTYDFETHFALFPEKLVDAQFTSNVKLNSYSENMSKINNISKDIIGFDKCTVSYSFDTFAQISANNKALFEQQFEGYRKWFDMAEIDINKIEAVRVYNLSRLQLIYNDYFSTNLFEGAIEDLRFYFYEGKWNIWPSLIEINISVALANRTNDVLKVSVTSGTVSKIEGHYVLLDSDKYARFFVRDISGIAVGDFVRVEYYEKFKVNVDTLSGEKATLVGTKSVNIE